MSAKRRRQGWSSAKAADRSNHGLRIVALDGKLQSVVRDIVPGDELKRDEIGSNQAAAGSVHLSRLRESIGRLWRPS
jgi:hypothetical protein